MTLSSSKAPGFIRLRYQGVTQPHTEEINIKFDEPPIPGSDPVLSQKGGGSITFVAAVNAWVTVLKTAFATGTLFGFADIYAVDPVTGVRTFIYTTTLAEVGTSSDPNIALVEGIFVFKTTAGKPLKVYVMEGVYTQDQRSVGTVPADSRQTIVDYVLDDDSIFYGRRDAWPLAFQSFTSKINDSLREREGFTGL
jgi:hypothetical protein